MADILKPVRPVQLAVAQETFSEAFAKLQADIRPAIKDATNPAFKSKYADLAAIWEAIKVPLKNHGFSVLQVPDFDGESIWLKTIILHTSGEHVDGRYPIRPIKQDPQGYGSALTYARRYSISAMLGVVADEDDDGNAASAKPTQREGLHSSPTMAAPAQADQADSIKKWCNDQKMFIANCETEDDVKAWRDLRFGALERLKANHPVSWGDLNKFADARIGNINLANTRRLSRANEPMDDLD